MRRKIMEDTTLKALEIIKKSKNIVVFTGAGISVPSPSSIPDFRSANGIYNQKLKSNIRPEEIISHSFFMKYPEDFFSFYFDKMVYLNALPNQAHTYLGYLENNTKQIKAIITQNIDGLHQMGGSKNVLELHGSIHRNYCMKCHRFYNLKDTLTRYQINNKTPLCDCGGIIKPDVVLYEECLDNDVLEQSISYISQADTLIVIGTSLVVYPASGLIQYFHGHNLIIINKSTTSLDEKFGYVIHDDIINVINKLEER